MTAPLSQRTSLARAQEMNVYSLLQKPVHRNPISNIFWHRNYGREFPCSTIYFCSACRFTPFRPQCKFLQVNRSNHRLFVERRSFGRPRDATTHKCRKPLHRSRASKGVRSIGSSKGEGNAGDDAQERAADSETDEEEEIREIKEEIESDLIAEKAGNSGFWGNWWGKVRQEVDDVAEADGQGNDDDGYDSEGGEEGNGGEVKQEDVLNGVDEDASTAEPSKTGFWRRLWRREAETPDVDPETSSEDELLLRDLENLQFRWKELLEPSVENVLALAVTALLALAGVQIIWQMVVVATAVTLSALKYTVLAAIIVGLLIFLL